MISSILLVCPKEAFLKALKEFPKIERQIKNASQLRKQRIEAKSQKLAKESSYGKTPLLKKTQYMYDLIFKWADGGTESIAKKRKSARLSRLMRVKNASTLETFPQKSITEDQSINISRNEGSQLPSTKRNISKPIIRKEGSKTSLMDKLKTLRKGYNDIFKPTINEKGKTPRPEIHIPQDDQEKDPIIVNLY